MHLKGLRHLASRSPLLRWGGAYTVHLLIGVGIIACHDLLGPVIYFCLGKSPSTGGLTEMKVDCPDLLGRLVGKPLGSIGTWLVPQVPGYKLICHVEGWCRSLLVVGQL